MTAEPTSQQQETAQQGERNDNNMARNLVNLHDSKALFDFCGGMMFQLVLSKNLKDHFLKEISDNNINKEQPDVQVFDATKSRMHQIPNYVQDNAADNVRIFHGREIRKVKDAAGGMGLVLQLSLANGKDPEGWTQAEIDGYDGWGHDSGRTWRAGDRLEQEGFGGFREQFGPSSFALHHRFYLHLDAGDRLWLSAEDGCEGTPASANPIQSFLRNLGM
jgi:hypothetical protein